MARALLFFTLAAVLSVVTFYGKSEHSFDFYLALPVGLYFIVAALLAFRPSASWQNQLSFAGLALVVWLILYGLSYNLLVVFIAPVAGGAGAWLVALLGQRFLNWSFSALRPIILTGLGTALAGILFMIAVRDLPKETFTIGLKAGVIVAFCNWEWACS